MCFARRCGWIVADPEHDERPGQGDAASAYAAAPKSSDYLAACTPRDRLMLATILHTGPRISEILGLVWDDVDFAAGVIHVRAPTLARSPRRASPRRRAEDASLGPRRPARSPARPPAQRTQAEEPVRARQGLGYSRPPAVLPAATATSAGAPSDAPHSVPD